MKRAPTREALSIAEMEKKYPDEWVLVEVTAVKRQTPAAGRLIAHSPDKAALYEAAMQFKRERPEAITYVFFAGGWPQDKEVII